MEGLVLAKERLISGSRWRVGSGEKINFLSIHNLLLCQDSKIGQSINCVYMIQVPRMGI